MSAVEFVPKQGDREDHGPRHLDDDRAELRRRPGRDDLGDEPIPGGHHPRRHPGHASRSWSTTRCSARERQEFMQAWFDAEEGKLGPFVLVLEGSVPNEDINGEGHWAAMGVDPSTGQPITTNEWPTAWRPRRRPWSRSGRALRTAAFPDEEQPDGGDGARGLPRLGLPLEGRPPDREHPGLPGAARQHDGDAYLGSAPRRPRAGA